jgi:hypothetical protein
MAFNLLGIYAFSDFISILSAIAIIIASACLLGIYHIELTKYLSMVTIELILYVSFTFGAYNTPVFFSEQSWHLWGTFFAVGLIASTFMTFSRINRDNTMLFFFVNMIIHGIIGTYLNSTFVCGISILFLMAIIGFHPQIGIGYIAFGYKESEIVPAATSASGLVLAVGIIFRLLTENNQLISHNFLLNKFQLFVPGILWVCPFVFYVSLLILSAHKYASKDITYVHHNIVAFALYIICVFIGNVYGIGQLSGFSGTFLVLFLLEKYVECMPVNATLYALSLLITSSVIYGLNIYYRHEIEKYGLEQYFHFIPSASN